jgi:hypothetical protein
MWSYVISEIISLSKLVEINLAELNSDTMYYLNLRHNMEPLEDEATLEHLHLGTLFTEDHANEVVTGIPLLRGLKEITLVLDNDMDIDGERIASAKSIIRALKQNIFLENINFCSSLHYGDYDNNQTKIQS